MWAIPTVGRPRGQTGGGGGTYMPSPFGKHAKCCFARAIKPSGIQRALSWLLELALVPPCPRHARQPPTRSIRTLWEIDGYGCTTCGEDGSTEWTCPALIQEYNDLAGNPIGTEADVVEGDGGTGKTELERCRSKNVVVLAAMCQIQRVIIYQPFSCPLIIVAAFAVRVGCA